MTIDLSGGIDPARELFFDERPEDPEFRDACNVWIESLDGSLAMRLGIEALAAEWEAHDIWLDVAFADGRVLSQRGSGTTGSALDADGRPTIRQAGSMKFQCIKPFEQWRVSYRGSAEETTARQLIDEDFAEHPATTDLEIEIEMTMVVPPWMPGSLIKSAGEILKGEQGEFMSPRYEQLFRAKGILREGGKARNFDACGLRIRRSGVRKFAGFWGHCWQSAVFPSGKAFGFNIYPPRDDGVANYAEGYVFDGTGVLKPATIVEVPWLTALQTHGDDVSFVLEVDGEQICVQGETFINTRSKGAAVLPPEFPIVQQAHARYRWDGEETVGMIERSSLPEKFTDRG